MQNSRGISTKSGHLEALRAKHAALQFEIDEERKHPATRGDILTRLKLQKLKIKERIIAEERQRA